ncbi:hypothetical protein C0992_012686, partial [Termitomyces sp. T32_za158]
HIRTLSEITDTVIAPVFPPVVQSVSFGKVIDAYIVSHGYTQEATEKLETAFISAQGNRSKFIQNVCFEGLPRAEAEWIWDFSDRL